jgi:hypothetical protein
MPTVSNPATLQSVINTFGTGGSPANLYAYRRGQSYVPDIPAYSGISTTQPALSSFAGLTYPFLDLPDYDTGSYDIQLYYSAQSVGNLTVYVEIVLNSNGTGAYSYSDNFSGGGDFLTFNWLLAGSASDYWAYMDAPAGSSFSAGSSPTGSSLQLNTLRRWRLSVVKTLPGITTAQLTSTLRIKNGQFGADMISKTLLMDVSAEKL